jgi:hypothetical protein
MILEESPDVTLPTGRIAAYEPSVGFGVAGGIVKGFVLYTLEKEQHDE